MFLDEVGEMPMPAQAKLLRALNDLNVRRIGSTRLEQVDVRIVAATNQDLNEMVKKRQFREDLFHRLSVIKIRTPSLRDRPEDIPELVSHFLDVAGRESGSGIYSITERALQLLGAFTWPGNVRELAHAIQDLVVNYDDLTITADAVKEVLRDLEAEDELPPPEGLPPIPLVDPITGLRHGENYSRFVKRCSLAAATAAVAAYPNKTEAADRLQIAVSNLNKKLRPDRRKEAAIPDDPSAE